MCDTPLTWNRVWLAVCVCGSQHGVQAVLYCAYKGNEEALDVLLDAGADPNSSDGVRDACHSHRLALVAVCPAPQRVRWMQHSVCV